MAKEWKSGLGPDGEGYAYGIAYDCTNDQRSVEECRQFNERSRRHYHMTPEKRKQDDFDRDWESFIEYREELRKLERHGYLRHYVEGTNV